jgi:hypothetical protein
MKSVYRLAVWLNAEAHGHKIQRRRDIMAYMLTLAIFEFMLWTIHRDVKSLANTIFTKGGFQLQLPAQRTSKHMGITWLLAATLVLLSWPMGNQPTAQNLPGKDGECPLSDNTYSVGINSTEFNGRVHESIQILIDPSPYPPPAGFFYTSIVDVLEKPDGLAPEVLPGDREISVLCLTPGTYRLRIRVNLIAKSSCGGAKASIIDEQEVSLFISG